MYTAATKIDGFIRARVHIRSHFVPFQIEGSSMVRFCTGMNVANFSEDVY